jgi:hypothetical protein
MLMALSTLSQFESTHATAIVPIPVRTSAYRHDCSLGLPNLRSHLATSLIFPLGQPFAQRAPRLALSIVLDCQALISWLLFVLPKQMIAVHFGSQCWAAATRSLLRNRMGILLSVVERRPFRLPVTLFAEKNVTRRFQVDQTETPLYAVNEFPVLGQ